MKTCLCCGYITLESDIHDICQICFWQDDPACWDDADANWGVNGISLREAQRNFIRFGACDKAMLNLVRPPGDIDKRDTNWNLLKIFNKQ